MRLAFRKRGKVPLSPKPTYYESRLLSPASPLAGPPHVRVTGFCRSLLNLGVRLTANEDSRACEIEPEQKRRHRIQSPIDPRRRTEMLLRYPNQHDEGKP